MPPAPALPNNLPDAFAGEPGETWTNNTGRMLYQAHCDFSNSCARCIQYAGRIGPWWPFPLHHRCRCYNIPIPPGHASAPFLDYYKEIEALDPKERSRAIGKANWSLIESGTVKFTDVVTRGRIRPLEEVVALQKLSIRDLLQGGVPKGIAQRAFAAVHSPEHAAAASAQKSALDRLQAAGLSKEQIKAEVKKRLLGRIGISIPPGAPPGTGAVETLRPKPSPTPAAAPIIEKAAQRKAPSEARQAPRPVSQSFKVDIEAQLGKRVSSAMNTIDRVHGGEGLSERPVPIKSSTRGTEWAQTTFRQDTPSSKRVPIGIKIDAKCADPELTIAHEVGHVVEATLSKKVEVERQMAEFRKAVSETEAVKRLQKLSTQNVASNSVGKAFRVSTEYVQYLLRNDELWARAYAQWIATESGDTKMLTQVLAVTKKRLAYRDEQWKPDDFKPVAEAMRAIFEKLGWLL